MSEFTGSDLAPFLFCCSLTGAWTVVLKRWLLPSLSVEFCSLSPVTPVISMRGPRSSLAQEPQEPIPSQRALEQWTSPQEEEAEWRGALQASTVPHSPSKSPQILWSWSNCTFVLLQVLQTQALVLPVDVTAHKLMSRQCLTDIPTNLSGFNGFQDISLQNWLIFLFITLVFKVHWRFCY